MTCDRADGWIVTRPRGGSSVHTCVRMRKRAVSGTGGSNTRLRVGLHLLIQPTRAKSFALRPCFLSSLPSSRRSFRAASAALVTLPPDSAMTRAR